MRQALANETAAGPAQQNARAKRLAELSAEIENIVAAVAAGLPVKAKLEATEAERAP